MWRGEGGGGTDAVRIVSRAKARRVGARVRRRQRRGGKRRAQVMALVIRTAHASAAKTRSLRSWDLHSRGSAAAHKRLGGVDVLTSSVRGTCPTGSSSARRS